MNLGKWGQDNGLELKIIHFVDPCRYIAWFKNTEVAKGVMLRSVYGRGSTVESAKESYFHQIIGTRLVVDASGPNRREVHVPCHCGASHGEVVS